MRAPSPKNHRRRIVMAVWVVIAGLAFATAAVTDGWTQLVLITIGCMLLLCLWAALRWPDLFDGR